MKFFYLLFFFKQKTAYEMRISDWSSDVCSSDLIKWHVRSKILDQLVKQLLVGGGRLKRIHVTKLIRQRVIFFGQIRSDVLDEIIDSILGCIKYRGDRTLAILTRISASDILNIAIEDTRML